MTQEKAVLNHLIENGQITSWEAFAKFRVTRLSAIIFNLRHDGFQIVTVMKTKENSYGNTVNFAEYHMVCPEKVAVKMQEVLNSDEG